MGMTDPIADMLTRIRNGNTAMHDEVLMPSSKQKEALAKVLKSEGYIVDYKVAENSKSPGKLLSIDMKYSPERRRVISGLRRVSKPGLRVYLCTWVCQEVRLLGCPIGCPSKRVQPE